MTVETFPRVKRLDGPAEIAPAGESLGQRIAKLQAAASALSRDQLDAMREQVMAGIMLAAEVAANPSQPSGARSVAEKIDRDGRALLASLEAITARS